MQLGVTDVTAFGGSYSNIAAYIHGVNNNGAPQFVTQDRISFAAFMTGLSATDSANLFNRVQAYRKALGGGFA
jgi:hypothetical protein